MMDEQTIDAMSTRIRALTRANEVLRAQRNELFEALRNLLAPDGQSVYATPDVIAAARTVLAKVAKWS
jgi:hypothetical protein